MAPFPPLSQTVSQDRISIKKDAHNGKGVFAAKQISLNTPILSVTRPLIVALDTQRLKDTCYHCHDWRERSFREGKNSTRDEVPLKACTGCKVVRYCNKVSPILERILFRSKTITVEVHSSAISRAFC